jgi:hypothetical protein
MLIFMENRRHAGFLHLHFLLVEEKILRMF